MIWYNLIRLRNDTTVIGGIIGGFVLLMVNPWHALAFLIFTAIIQTVDGYILKPKLFGDSLGVSGLLIMAAVMLICGVVIFLHPDDLVRLIPTIMGILVLISGLINLGETFMLTRSKYNKWWASLIVAIATIAAGIFLIRNAFNLASLITRIAGGILIFDGISDLWVISRVSKAHKEMEVEATAVDVEAAVTEQAEAPAENAGSGNETPAAEESAVHQPPAEADPVQPSADPAESSVVPEYMEQTEQDTDFSSFAGSDDPKDKQDEEKAAE